MQLHENGRKITAKNWPKRLSYRIGLSVAEKLSSQYDSAPKSVKVYVRKSQREGKLENMVIWRAPRPENRGVGRIMRSTIRRRR